MSILVSTCQAFSDIWGVQAGQLDKYWGDRPWPTYFLTDTNKDKVRLDNVSFIEAGPKTGMDVIKRLDYFLSQIDSPYVFITLDDYFLIRPVKTREIIQLVERMKEEDLSYVRLYLHPKYKRKDKIKGQKGFYRLDYSRDYMVNLYPGIWKTDFLRHAIKTSKAENIWYFEASLTKIAKEANAECLVSLHKEYEFIDGVRKGKFLHKSYRYLKKNHLYEGNRGVNTWRYEISLGIRTLIGRCIPKWLKRKLKAYGRKHGKIYYSD